MNKLGEIEEAVMKLPKDGLAKFRAWFAHFDAHEWDEQFVKDIESGKLDELTQKARSGFENGQCTDL